jgi:hydroxyacylglutathione hydrolase
LRISSCGYILRGRRLEPKEDTVIFERYYLSCLSHASYLVGDEGTKTAVVIDPQRDVEHYLADAEARGLTIRYVFLTHFHADFLAGHLELVEKVGAEVRLGSRAEAGFPFRAMEDGERLELGDVSLEVLETPGHTPEGISIVLRNRAEGDQPQAVFTGDTLFVGDVGRPDLLASFGVSEQELAGMLYDSLHGKLLQLPDETVVYPAHGAGSLCGKALGAESSSTIGQERRSNLNLRPMTKQEFTEVVSRGQIDAPAYFAHDAILNRQPHPTRLATAPALSLELALREVNAGAVLVDVRDGHAFAREHLAGSLNLSLEGRFASWAGTLLEVNRPIVLLAPAGREQEAVTRLGRIGFDWVKGYLAGGAEAALSARPDLSRSIPRIPVEALEHPLTSDPEVFVLDVRNPAEWEAGHVPGSVNIPLNQLAARIDEVPSDRRVFVHCRTEYRSSAALGILEQAGKTVTQVTGGWQAYEALQLAGGAR